MSLPREVPLPPDSRGPSWIQVARTYQPPFVPAPSAARRSRGDLGPVAFRPRLSPGVALSRQSRRYACIVTIVTTRPGRAGAVSHATGPHPPGAVPHPVEPPEGGCPRRPGAGLTGVYRRLAAALTASNRHRGSWAGSGPDGARIIQIRQPAGAPVLGAYPRPGPAQGCPRLPALAARPAGWARARGGRRAGLGSGRYRGCSCPVGSIGQAGR